MKKAKSKILFVQTEDWFFLSHFKELAKAAIASNIYEVSLITTIKEKQNELKKLNLKTIPVDFKRSSFNLLLALKLIIHLIIIFKKEKPNIIHLISLKPMFIGGVAAFFLPKTAIIYHLTGLGYLAEGNSFLAKIRRLFFFKIISLCLKRKQSWLIVENPDDREFLIKYGAPPNIKTSILAGSGIDVEHFIEQPKCSQPKAAFVGRMIASKGVDILVKAKAELQKRNINLDIELYGEPDLANPNSIPQKTLEHWNSLEGITWHGSISDVRKVWQYCDIAIIPTITREGMPRAMLEAAASGRALIVSNVVGCKHFVDDKIEGLIVPPNDEIALANAMEKLFLDKNLRRRMGAAARKKILKGYTKQHITTAVLKIYQELNN